jgi:hypothetical protein
MRRGGIGAAVLLCATALTAQSPPDWTAADRAIRRLAPSALSSLPAAIRADLTRRGCTVPQTYMAKAPANAIRGHFFGPSSDDWAVLCSRNRSSAILVYRQGQSSRAAEFGHAADSGYLQTIDAERTVGFSRDISTASPEQIRKYQDRLPKPLLAAIDHDGIEDAFIEKASQVRYFANGKWIVVPGAD